MIKKLTDLCPSLSLCLPLSLPQTLILQPLLCISLLVLLLLPPSLSCNTKPLREVAENYASIVKIDLDIAVRDLSVCPSVRPYRSNKSMETLDEIYCLCKYYTV